MNPYKHKSGSSKRKELEKKKKNDLKGRRTLFDLPGFKKIVQTEVSNFLVN